MTIKTKLFLAFLTLSVISALIFSAAILCKILDGVGSAFFSGDNFLPAVMLTSMCLLVIGLLGMFITACLPNKKDK